MKIASTTVCCCYTAALLIVGCGKPTADPAKSAVQQSSPEQTQKVDNLPLSPDQAIEFNEHSMAHSAFWCSQMALDYVKATGNALATERQKAKIDGELAKLSGRKLKWPLRVLAVTRANDGMANLSFETIDMADRGFQEFAFHPESKQGFLIPLTEKVYALQVGKDVPVTAIIAKAEWSIERSERDFRLSTYRFVFTLRDLSLQ